MVFGPDDDPKCIQDQIDGIFAQQERAHFSDQRYTVLFKPGVYPVHLKVGFFTQVCGTGLHPADVRIDGQVECNAKWINGSALVNFWRGAENLSIRPPGGESLWAVSQAAPLRRILVEGDLRLFDTGPASGGFMADCRVTGTVRFGSQQQWYTRNSAVGVVEGGLWNMVFEGTVGAPPSQFPNPPYTSIRETRLMREKPFLRFDQHAGWSIVVPSLRQASTGPGWDLPHLPSRTIPLSETLIARPSVTVEHLNHALARGQHLLFTPGIYRFAEPLRIRQSGTVVLGLGLATIEATAGNIAVTVDDIPDVSIAGLLIDAGRLNSPTLMRIGTAASQRSGSDQRNNPVLLADLYFRVGGARIGNTTNCLEINSHDVIGDHLWLWRADHGELDGSRVHVRWDESRSETGLIVNGDDVSAHGLFVEHFQRYQTIWNGERGYTVFYQSELPYDPPSQAAWMAGSTRGWAAYKIAERVRSHQAIGLGVYAYLRDDPSIVLESAVECPSAPGIGIEAAATVSLGGNGAIAHIVNDQGARADDTSRHQTLSLYSTSFT